MKVKKHYYLMISCPGDVIHERKLLKECVEDINNERTDDVWVELQYWVTDTSSDASTPAQESINEQIVSACDGLIAIFNARLGTPVHEYKCGTDEEISLMLKANKHVSLLFNTKPSIDLSNPTCIEQITKLQEYKIEQSQKAYYREFSDPKSFSVLARREILMWIRSITKCSHQNATSYISEDANRKIDDDAENAETHESYDVEVVSPSNIPVDTEAGAVDCVVYITDAATILTEEINSFAKCGDELNGLIIDFNNKINFWKKRNMAHSGMLLICKQFAAKADENKNKAGAILDNIESKWNEIYQYMLIYNKLSLNIEDATILKDSISSLKQCFAQSIPEIDTLIEVFNSIPNLQKDFKKSLRSLSDVYKRFKAFTNKATANCEELELSILEEVLIEA